MLTSRQEVLKGKCVIQQGVSTHHCLYHFKPLSECENILIKFKNDQVTIESLSLDLKRLEEEKSSVEGLNASLEAEHETLKSQLASTQHGNDLTRRVLLHDERIITPKKPKRSDRFKDYHLYMNCYRE